MIQPVILNGNPTLKFYEKNNPVNLRRAGVAGNAAGTSVDV
jgi:hypothetical protein